MAVDQMSGPGMCRLRPKFSARELRTFGQRFQFRPHDRGVNTAVELLLGKAAIRTSDNVFAARHAGESHDAFRDEFRMFNTVVAVADAPGNQHLAIRQLHIFPHPPFMLVTWTARFDQISSRADFQNEVDDLSEWNVGRMRSGPTAPANVIAY